MRQQFPVPIRGIDMDNDGAFISETLPSYCQQEHLEFTRSRACQKNDQAWIEQAKSLMERLQKKYPGQFAEGQLRTLQRRIREWRGAMARTSAYACLDRKQATENPVVGGTERNG